MHHNILLYTLEYNISSVPEPLFRTLTVVFNYNTKIKRVKILHIYDEYCNDLIDDKYRSEWLFLLIPAIRKDCVATYYAK